MSCSVVLTRHVFIVMWCNNVIMWCYLDVLRLLSSFLSYFHDVMWLRCYLHCVVLSLRHVVLSTRDVVLS